MKMDQVAFYCLISNAENLVKKSFGLEKADWIHDTVTADSVVWGAPKQRNVAELQFNYNLGIELEIIRYIDGPSWHDPFVPPTPFFSHIGIHLDDDEDFPSMHGCKLAQETWTISHTSEYLTTGAGAGRKYHYKIFELSPGNFIKYIKRIYPK